jgi:hypothetical protein
MARKWREMKAAMAKAKERKKIRSENNRQAMRRNNRNIINNHIGEEIIGGNGVMAISK